MYGEKGTRTFKICYKLFCNYENYGHNKTGIIINLKNVVWNIR